MDAAAGGTPRRLRVIISAYAFGPARGPEGMAGWAFAIAAAARHDVWVITRKAHEKTVSEALRADPPLAEHLKIIYIDLPQWAISLRRTPLDLYWYYILWQRLLGSTAVQLHQEFNFQVAHHITFANDWLPSGLTRLQSVPLIWGPVGGASRVPVLKLRRWLGARGSAIELLRSILTSPLRSLWGARVARRAALVVAQNPDVGHHFRNAKRVIVEANAALDEVVDPTGAAIKAARVEGLAEGVEGRKTALFVGRLIGFKCPRLAIATIAHPTLANWSLEIFGTGYERRTLERMAKKLGISDRVTFRGHQSRTEVLDAYHRADSFLFPSAHDQAGWVVAEASSVGCPVVCLPLGGPPFLAERNAYVASLDGDIVANLAAKLLESGVSRGQAHNRWATSRLPNLVDEWYRSAWQDAEPPVTSARTAFGADRG